MPQHTFSTNMNRRAGRDHAGRLDKLEDAVLPKPENPHQAFVERWVALQQWAYKTGGHARELEDQLTRFCTGDLLHFMARDDVSAVYVKGSTERGDMRWNFTPEQQAEYDALNHRADAVWAELNSLYAAAQQTTQQEPQP